LISKTGSFISTGFPPDFNVYFHESTENDVHEILYKGVSIFAGELLLQLSGMINNIMVINKMEKEYFIFQEFKS